MPQRFDITTDVQYRVCIYKEFYGNMVFRDVWFSTSEGKIGFDMSLRDGAPWFATNEAAQIAGKIALETMPDADGFVTMMCDPITVKSMKDYQREKVDTKSESLPK